MIAAIRVRGSTKIKKDIKQTLEQLRLDRVNHLVLLEKKPSIIGMLKKTENYITFGEIDKKTLQTLLEKRARLPGNKKPTKKELEKIGVKNFEELAEKAIKNKKILEKIGLKKVFRLRPPKKGFERKGIKRAFTEGGALGDRESKINNLILRMV